MMTYYDPAIMRVQPVSELWVARLEKKKKGLVLRKSQISKSHPWRKKLSTCPPHYDTIDSVHLRFSRFPTFEARALHLAAT